MIIRFSIELLPEILKYFSFASTFFFFFLCISLIRFLRLLIEKLQLPVYCLVDSDPYGMDILTTYRFGSMVRRI